MQGAPEHDGQDSMRPFLEAADIIAAALRISSFSVYLSRGALIASSASKACTSG